jgi:predicted dithiol-disulfide oxidoreductase (DUF899 family)
VTEHKAQPNVVSAEEWQQARDELLVAEKEATRALDALAARRRRLPMKKIANDYVFDGPDGKVTLLDLFQGRSQLALYQFMDAGPGNYCPGCTWFTDAIPANAFDALADRDISWATVSDMPLSQIEPYKQQKGWTMPFVSSRGTTFADDCGVIGFQLSVFLRDGDDIYLTYATMSRGVDRMIFVHNIQDLMPYGRQQDWEDSPAGWPQKPTYG